uniref:Uncharacterized protein n=1 Tax=Solanum lycopersicum TaxID=4081 RepID=K4D923_SOLLC
MNLSYNHVKIIFKRLFSHLNLVSGYWGPHFRTNKQINLDSPLWLRWRLDQRVIASRETPIEVHYESLGTFYEIYGHYLIVRSLKKSFLYTFEPLLVILLFIEKSKKLCSGFLGPIHMLPNSMIPRDFGAL